MKKKIIIIGGGIIGCLTAIYLRKKNQKVYLYEQDKSLGGVLSDFHFDSHSFLKGTQYLDVKEEWFKILNKLAPKYLINFNFNYGSFTNLNKKKIVSSKVALPVINYKKKNIRDYLKNKKRTGNLKDRIDLYPNPISKLIYNFVKNCNLNPKEIDESCCINLGISRVNILNNDDNIKRFKKQNLLIDKLYAVERKKIFSKVLKYSLPNKGYSQLFNVIEKKMKKMGIKIFKDSRIFSEWQNNKLKLFYNKKEIINDYIFWSGNPTQIIKNFNNIKLDSLSFKSLQVNANLKSKVKDNKFIQVYSDKSKIFRINLYKLNAISKIGIECIFNKSSTEELLRECKDILKYFKIKIHYDKKTINKKLFSRFDMITVRDKKTIEGFLKETKNTNLLYNPWTTYGRSKKIELILKNLQKRRLI